MLALIGGVILLCASFMIGASAVMGKGAAKVAQTGKEAKQNADKAKEEKSKGKRKSLIQELRKKITSKATRGVSDKGADETGKKQAKELMMNLVYTQLKALASTLRGTGASLLMSGMCTIIGIIFFVVILVVAVAGVIMMSTDGSTPARYAQAMPTTQDSGGGGGGTLIIGDNSSWVSSCQTMFDWYQANIDTYQTVKQREVGGSGAGVRQWYACPLVDNYNVGDDCSAFVTACMMYAGLIPNQSGWGSSYFCTSENHLAILREHFNHYTPADLHGSYTPRVGDIIAYTGHVEIIAKIDNSGQCYSWSWGRVPRDQSAKYIQRASSIDVYIQRMWSNNNHTVTDIWQLK